jgi:hypothetical protein
MREAVSKKRKHKANPMNVCIKNAESNPPTAYK